MPRKTSNIKQSDQNKAWNKRKQLSKITLNKRNPVTTVFELVKELNTHL